MRRVRGVAAIALASGLAWDVQPPPRVWCVGDSITHFYVPALVRLEPAWTVLDLGRGAKRSDHGLVRLLGLLAENPPPDVVVLLFGANDVGARVLEGDRAYGPAEAAANIHRMALLVLTAGAIPIVGLPVRAHRVARGGGRAARHPLSGRAGKPAIAVIGKLHPTTIDGLTARRLDTSAPAGPLSPRTP